MADVLPISSGKSAMTVRHHVLCVAGRLEKELTEDRSSFMEDCSACDWENLPISEGRVVVGFDGGYVRDWCDRKRNFELIVGRSIPEDRNPRYLGFVQGHDRKPQRRVLDHLKRQGVQPDQDITFITDGGEEVRSLAEAISPCSEHVLDWFHITMRNTVLNQFAQGLQNYDNQAGVEMLDNLERIEWYLLHGNTYRAGDEIDGLFLDAECLDTTYPNVRKFITAIGEFRAYITGNKSSLINYSEGAVTLFEGRAR